MVRLQIVIILLLAVPLVVIPLSTVGCTSNSGSKLSSALIQLIEAEKQGKAEELARQGDIKLLDGSVRVTIQCLPGQVEAAARTVTAVGIVEIVDTRANSIQAVVPITSLNALAGKRSINFIRLPMRAQELGQAIRIIKEMRLQIG